MTVEELVIRICYALMGFIIGFYCGKCWHEFVDYFHRKDDGGSQ